MRIPPPVAVALATVPAPDPFDLDVYLADVQRVRGRRLILHDMPPAAAAAAVGLLLVTDQADHIYVLAGAAGLLRSNIVLHEVGHLLLDHQHPPGGDHVVGLFEHNTAPPAEVQRALSRSAYNTREERHAELFATVILQGSAARRGSSNGDALSMLGEVMGHPVRRERE